MIKLNYSTYGPRSQQPVILFLHGFMGSRRDWHRIASGLSERCFCLVPDLPGHGGSAGGLDQSWDMDNTARSLIALLDSLQIRESYLAGYSMGGRLGLYLALHYPHYFPKTVLESASPGLRTEAERAARTAHDKRLAERLLREDLPTFLQEWYRQPLFQSLQTHPGFSDMLARRLDNDPAALAKSLREAGSGVQPSQWERLETHKMPLLLVIGEKDVKFHGIAEEMQQLNPRVEMAVIADCGHNVHFENPQAFTEQLIYFFRLDR